MKKFWGNAVGVAGLTMISQILGYVREMLFAYYLGTAEQLEAFQVAETVPLLFTQVLISAVPLALTPLLVTEKKQNEDALIHSAIALWGSVLTILVVIVLIFPNLLVEAVAPGFQGDKFYLTCRLVTILAPNIFFLSMVAVFNSFLNAQQQFLLPAATNLFLNTGIVFMQIMTGGNVLFVASGAVCGGLLMFLTSICFCINRYGLRFGFSKVRRGAIKYIVRSILPVCIISSFASVNLMLDKFFASQLENGAVAILSYSYKIVNLPVYLFSTSVTKVILPGVTEIIINKDEKSLRRIIIRTLGLCLVGGLLAVAGIQILGSWAVELLFGRGAFGQEDVLRTASALKFYSFGIAGMALNSFFQSVSYAGGKYYEPLKVIVIQIVIYVAVTAVSLPYLRVNAIVLGNVLAYNAVIVVWILLIKKNYKIKFLKGV